MELANDTVIKVEGLHKKFCRHLRRSMFYGTLDVTRDMLGWRYDGGTLRQHEFWSLEDVNFELKQGEALGVIGPNGSGKTTLLRILNGIFPPDRGSVAVRGRIGALIAVGAGFHPNMTGRENIRLNGTILGMTRDEIAARFDAIVDFADIGEFLDAPVATYSSGMTVRLGFAIAIHAVPEILLADEVLAVGDLRFALKCYRKIAEYRRNGGALILVSHAMQLVRNVCHRSLWLEHGRVKALGETQEVCDAYEQDTLQRGLAGARLEEPVRINHDPLVRITKVEFRDAGGAVGDLFPVGAQLRVRIHYACGRVVTKPNFSISLVTVENIIAVANHSLFDAPGLCASIAGSGWVDFVLPTLALKPGHYYCTAILGEGSLDNNLDWHERAYRFAVTADGWPPMSGLFQPAARWDAGPTTPGGTV